MRRFNKEADELERRAAELRRQSEIPQPMNDEIKRLEKEVGESQKTYNDVATRLNKAAEDLKQRKLSIYDSVVNGKDKDVDRVAQELVLAEKRVEILSAATDAAKEKHSSILYQLQDERGREIEAMRIRENQQREAEQRELERQAREELKRQAGNIQFGG